MSTIYPTFSPGDVFPFRLVYKDTKKPQEEMPDHMHDGYEMVYVYKGTGTFFIDRAFYEMKAGDLFLLPPNLIHRAFPDAKDPVTSTALFFGGKWLRKEEEDILSPLHCFDRARASRLFRLSLNHPLKERVGTMLDRAYAEWRGKRLGYEQFIRAELNLMLLHLSRESETDATRLESNSHETPLWLRTTLAHIDQYPRSDLSLSSLCKIVSVSPAHFSRTFRKSIGMTVTDYIVAKRISLAKERLLSSDDPVNQISINCGFESLPYFFKKFKKHTGHTPQTYRNLFR
ncbi:AraC family transcriptional regulator [Paenibacillus sp. TRM 82003]|nr:AraC family transcriptional regulator [Paenibacillus sp. TRM 82003]